MTVTLYSSFSKRQNSTKQPTGGTSFTTVKLKENTSVEAPVFILTTNANNWTYASAFGHYYFVTNIVHVTNTLCEIHCVCDPMADNKSAIIASSQYVERCATQAYWNVNLVDDIYPVEMDPDIFTSPQSIGFTTGTDAALILSVKSAGGTSFWAMRRGLFAELGDALYTMSQDQDTLWSALNASTLYKNYLDPMSYITNAIIIPIDAHNLSGTSSTNTIDIGYWSYTESLGVEQFSKISGQIIYSGGPYTYTLQAKSTQERTFLNSNKYRQYEVILPGVGSITLDGDIVLTGNNIKVSYKVDVVGGICYEIAYGSGNVYKDYVNGNIAIPFAVHGQTADLNQTVGAGTNLLGGIAGGVAAGAAGGPVGMVAGGLVGGVMSAAHSIANAGPLYHTKTAGHDGSFARFSLSTNIIFKETIYKPSNFGIDRLGVPCMQNVTLSNLSGYVKCRNASVELNCFESERAVIENYMNTGFYIE